MSHVAQMIAWAALAAACTALSWRNAMAVIGVMLTLCSLITSAAYFGSDLTVRLVLEVCQALAVGHTARIAFAENRTWPVIAVLVLAMVDCALAGALGVCLLQGTVSAGWVKVYLGWGTNAVFFVQCLCVACGTRDVSLADIGSRGLARRRDRDDGVAAYDASCDAIRRLP